MALNAHPSNSGAAISARERIEALEQDEADEPAACLDCWIPGCSDECGAERFD